MNTDPFRAWVREQGYSASSARKAATDVATMAAHGPTPPESQRQRSRLRDFVWAWDLYDAYRQAVPRAAAFTVPRPELPPAPQVGRRLRREPKRLLEAVSIDDLEWARFSRAVVSESSLPARTLHVLCDTGLRISDVLRVTRAQIEHGFARADRLTEITVKGGKARLIDLGGAEDAWRRLREGMVGHGATVQLAQVISPKSDPDAIVGGAAYHAVRRELLDIAARTNLTGRVHLHRLRRTVTIQVLRSGGTLEDARQVLGHEDTRTTSKSYADEGRAHDAANALKRARARRDELDEGGES